VTKRVELRPYTADDEAAVHRYAADPEVTRYTDWGPNSPADTAAFIQSALDPAPGTYPFAIILTAGGTLIGGCELRVDDERAELGYVLGRPWWGQGYATEAASTLLGFGVNEPFIPDHLPVRGGWRDSLLFRADLPRL
jgi:ribosomal-protein-alanine N-acetyltransferase